MPQFDLKLGRLPGKMPVGLKDLTFYHPGPLPKAPAKVAVPPILPQPDGTAWGMDGNDQYGDCGVAGITHGFMADAAITWASDEAFPSADDIVSYYLTYTGGDDTGVVLSDFLAYVRKTGFFGHTIQAYAPVRVHDTKTLHFAVNAYGFAYTGIEVTSGMMQDFQDGKPWVLESFDSDVEGGHCVPIVGYDSHWLYAVTWGKVQKISYAVWPHLSSEAWAVITGEFAAKGGDGRGLNLAALEADLNRIG